jgi:hypothetical protein
MTTKEIADGNDLLRTGLINDEKNRTVMSRSVALNPRVRSIVEAIRSFNDFNEKNDPYQEHDSATVTVQGQSFRFKIDYYDEKLEYGLDPSEGEVYRVMTIMRSDDR